jgi:hypothetical protein
MSDRWLSLVRLVVLAAVVGTSLSLAVSEILSLDQGLRGAAWRVLVIASVGGLAFSALVRLLDGSLTARQRFWPGWERVVGVGALVGASLGPFIAALLSEQYFVLLLGAFAGFLLGVTFLYPLPEHQQWPPGEP